MNNELDTREAVIGDLLYLTEELTALSNLIQSFPVHDRPPEGLSICETIRFIGYAQSSYKYMFQSAQSLQERYDSLMDEFLDNRLTIEKETSTGIEVFIEEVISDRLMLVEKIRNNHPEEMSTEVLACLAAIDRHSLKMIADVILSMEQNK